MYSRVSRASQVNDDAARIAQGIVRHSLQSQEMHMRRKVEELHRAAGNKEPLRPEDCTLIVEQGSGRSITRRKGFQHILANAKSGDVIVTYISSRISRNLRDVLTIIETITTPHGIRIVTVKEGLDTAVESHVLRFKFLTIMNEHQLVRTRRRIRDALRQLRTHGRHIGRPRKGWRVFERRAAPEVDFDAALQTHYRASLLRALSRQARSTASVPA